MAKTTFTNELTTQFLDFVSNATSPYQVVATCQQQLAEMGFIKLNIDEKWNLIPGNAYYTDAFGTTLFAFRLPEHKEKNSIFRIVSTHTDHPGVRIKPNPIISKKGYISLNVETYGGAILNTWLDRPLSIAGKITLKTDKIFSPETKLVDFKRPLLTIPNLAIHMNRAINSGIELNKQTDLLPIVTLEQPDLEPDFNHLLAEELDLNADHILDYDLHIYNAETGTLLGMNNEFYSGPRLDNLTSVYAALQGIIRAEHAEKDILISAFYDNEEVGSKTKQGADSSLTAIFLEKLYRSLPYLDDDFQDMLLKSFMISADVAHATHPNHIEKNDLTNTVILNQGVALKLNSNQRYATDTEAIGVIQQICETYAIPYQKYVNRSDIAGGGTLGSITSSWLPMKTVDLGIPILAMHSARETAGVQDEISLMRLIHAFYSCDR